MLKYLFPGMYYQITFLHKYQTQHLILSYFVCFMAVSQRKHGRCRCEWQWTEG